MAMRRALLSSFGTAGGTIVALGGGTLLLSNTCIAVGRTINRRQRLKHAVRCASCSGEGRVACSVCKGEKLVKWSPFDEEQQIERLCLCPTCRGKQQSKCLNCLGEGIVY